MPLDPRLQRAVADLLPLSESLAWAFFARVPVADPDELKSITAEALVQSAHRWVGPYCAAHGFNPWDEGDPSKPERHWSGFAIKRMKGALLDWARSQDRITRTQRRGVKAMDAAFDDGIRGEEEQAAAAGLTVAKAREARAAAALTTVSLDDTLVSLERGSLPDERAEVESEVTVRETLAAAVAAFDALPAVPRVLLALVFHQELPLDVAAKSVHLEPAEARRQLEAAVCEIHSALLRSVQDEGAGPGRPGCRSDKERQG